MIQKYFLVAVLLCTFGMIDAQEVKVDSVAVKTAEEEEKPWSVGVDLVSRNLWRGQMWGDHSLAIQPYGSYQITDKLSVGFWATRNFKKAANYLDGTSYDGYQELDLIINYAVTDYLTLSLQNYYWPTVEKVEGVDNSPFNFGNDGVSTIDFMLMFNFTEKGFPLWFTWSTFLSGNDFRYDETVYSETDFDEEGEPLILSEDTKGTRNFTSYAEVGYNFDLPYKFTVSPVVGAVINNKASYYTYADYDKLSFVNLGVKVTRPFELENGIAITPWVNYTHNATKMTSNLVPHGANLVTFGLSLGY